MISIDDRAGSRDLIAPLKKIAKCEVKKCRLTSADAAWKGVDGKTYGVEVKHLNDVIQCIQNGRFVTQLRAMQQEYDVYYLLIVDEFRSTATMELEFKKKFGRVAAHWFHPYTNGREAVTYVGLINWITTMMHGAGCYYDHVADNDQAAAWIYAKYMWSQKKKHKSLDVFDTSRPPARKKGKVTFVGSPNRIAKMVNAMVDGIGWDKAKAISYHFDSPRAFMRAKPGELLKIPGIGPKLVKKIVEARRTK